MPKSITIITDSFCDKIEGTRYFVAHLAGFWQRQGIEIHVTAGCNHVPADIAILHVDTTVVGDDYLVLGTRYPITLNGKVKDILKTSFSRNLLRMDSSYQGPVIVKTNANYGGINEFLNEGSSIGSAILPQPIDRPWRKREVIEPLNYPVFARLADVPQGVWKNNKLIVEKFLPERLESGDYRCRVYIFFGEQEFAAWFTSPKPIIKSTVATDMGVLDQIPRPLTELRKASGFDFGKFDYTEVNGEIFVYDMNKTPAFGPEILNLISNHKINDFADEIHTYER